MTLRNNVTVQRSHLMLNVGWSELLVIGIVLLVVVGPRDLPQTLRAFGRMIRGLGKMSSEFRTQFEEALRKNEIDELRRGPGDVANFDPSKAIRDAVSPFRQTGQGMRADIDNSARLDEAPVAKSSDVAARTTAGERGVPQEPVIVAKTLDPSLTVSMQPGSAGMTGGAPAVSGKIDG
jgi:sec-independent protein translocase protein TatB